MYCVNENKDAKAHFGFFFNFSFCHSYITHMDVFVRVFSATTSQVKKWVGIPVGSHWDPNRDPGGIYRDKNSGSRLGSRRDPGGIPPKSRWDPAQIPTGFWRDLVGFDQDIVGIPSGFTGIPSGFTGIPSGFTGIPAG